MNKLKITKNLYKTIEKEVYEKFPWTDFKIRFLENTDYRLEVVFYYKGKKEKTTCIITNDSLKDYDEAETFTKDYMKSLEAEINRLINSENERN